MTAWAAGSPLRAYQQHALDGLRRQLSDPGTRACLVAPPGAGKTRMALHLAADLGHPIEVRVPTTALAQQWRTAARHHLVSLAPGQAAPIRIATYASRQEPAVGALVVLDECHHLCGAWGQQLLDALGPHHRVLGLTGTPPHGHPRWDRFSALVGAEPVVVDAPPLVRDGHLCPYVDLAWPVVAEADDLPELQAASDALAQAEHHLGDTLTAWVSAQLREHRWQLTEDRFAGRSTRLQALCRHQHAWGRDLPDDLPVDPELIAIPTLADRAELLRACGGDQAQVSQALGAAGFRVTGTGLTMTRDVGWRALAAAGARLRGALDVLAHEHAARTDGLRALVVTDRDTEGGRLSARAVLKALVHDRRTDPLDPILVTGTVFWIDDDLWPRVGPRLPDLPWVAAAGHHEVDVSGWSTGERVALATRLLSEGLTRCLVGTRHLLGEGWDCPPVNCVLDLTGIQAPVTVNQVRGRGLRQDPGDPSKVATLWEVLVLAPGVAGGDRMLETVRARHRHTFGLDEEGRIRTGATRLDPALALPLGPLAAEAEAVQARAVSRLHDRGAAAAAWAVGQDYMDRHTWQVVTGPALTGGTGCGPRVLQSPAAPGPTARTVLLGRRRWQTAGLVLAGTALLLAAPAAGPVAALGLVPLAVAAWVGRRPVPGVHDARLRALAEALEHAGLAQGTLHHTDQAAWLDGPDPAGRVFAEACAALLGPVRHPRYLLAEPDGRLWPVPSALGATRALADALGTAWAGRVGPCEVVWARQGRGQDWLREAWRTESRPPVALLELWE